MNFSLSWCVQIWLLFFFVRSFDRNACNCAISLKSHYILAIRSLVNRSRTKIFRSNKRVLIQVQVYIILFLTPDLCEKISFSISCKKNNPNSKRALNNNWKLISSTTNNLLSLLDLKCVFFYVCIVTVLLPILHTHTHTPFCNVQNVQKSALFCVVRSCIWKINDSCVLLEYFSVLSVSFLFSDSKPHFWQLKCCTNSRN